MRTGVIVDLNRTQAMILLNDGTFQKIRKKRGYRVGEVIIIPVQGKKLYHTTLFVIAASLILCTLSAITGFRVYTKPTAVVSIDINPSIELNLNRFGKIVSVKAWNREGAKVLETVLVKNKNYQQGVQLLMSSALMQSYIAKDNYIRVAVQSETEAETIKDSVQEVIRNEIERRQVEIESFCVDHSLLEQAHHYGMSAGKYLAVEELSEVDASVDIEEYSHCTIREIKEMTDKCSGETNHHGQEGTHHCR